MILTSCTLVSDRHGKPIHALTRTNIRTNELKLIWFLFLDKIQIIERVHNQKQTSPGYDSYFR